MDEARMTRHNKTRSRATNTPSASLPLRDAFASQRIAALFLSWNDIIVLAPRRFILIQSGTSADLCGIARGRAERLGPGATEQMYLAFIVVMRAALRSVHGLMEMYGGARAAAIWKHKEMSLTAIIRIPNDRQQRKFFLNA